MDPHQPTDNGGPGGWGQHRLLVLDSLEKLSAQIERLSQAQANELRGLYARLDQRDVDARVLIDATRRELRAEVEKVRDEIKKQYVTREEHNPVALSVYGFIGLVLTAFIIALLAFVWRNP